MSLVLAGLSAMASMAQSSADPMVVPASDLFDLTRNRVQLPGGRAAWDGLFGELDRLWLGGEGQVNIVHIGGSHIQADMWTARLRDRLQRVAPGTRAGRGFIFPYNMAGSNNPYWYEPVYTGRWSALKNTAKGDVLPLGLAGHAVTTRDTLTSLRISFRGGMYAGYTFTRATVLYDPDSSFMVTATCTRGTQGVMVTDDLRNGVSSFTFDEDQDTLYLTFERTDPLRQSRFRLYGILLETDDPGIYYHALGVNGAATRNWLKCTRLERELGMVRPDLVVFSIGINDAHDPDFCVSCYERNYAALIATVRRAAPDAAILLVTNSDSYRKRRIPMRNAEDVRDAMLRVASVHGAGVWDLFGVMGGHGSIRRWQRQGYAKPDLIHFNRQGYTMIGDLMFTALMKAYGEHLRTSSAH